MEAARDSMRRSAPEVRNALLAQVRAFVGDCDPFDDIAVAVLVRDGD